MPDFSFTVFDNPEFGVDPGHTVGPVSTITVTDNDTILDDSTTSSGGTTVDTNGQQFLTADFDGYPAGSPVASVEVYSPLVNDSTGDVGEMYVIRVYDGAISTDPSLYSEYVATTIPVSEGDVLSGLESGSALAAVPYANLNVCFTRDTMIDTDAGEVAVQDLSAGMMVRTRDNGMQPIRWIGMSPARDRAVRIKAGAMGNTRDLVVSPRHRMVLDGWQLEMLFDHDHALVTALELVNDDTIVRDAMADVEYYHVMFDAHEVIYAEAAATESFHPDQPSMGSMDAAAREEIFALFPELRDGAKRDEAAVNLSPVQAAYVGKNLDAFIGK